MDLQVLLAQLKDVSFRNFRRIIARNCLLSFRTFLVTSAFFLAIQNWAEASTCLKLLLPSSVEIEDRIFGILSKKLTSPDDQEWTDEMARVDRILAQIIAEKLSSLPEVKSEALIKGLENIGYQMSENGWQFGSVQYSPDTLPHVAMEALQAGPYGRVVFRHELSHYLRIHGVTPTHRWHSTKQRSV
ncbi:MAG: hypothetical protein IPK68_21585 [Bdellovibrionales bacterium]|nr:hypothetical protein [Bdellovibrionales bacterium]